MQKALDWMVPTCPYSRFFEEQELQKPLGICLFDTLCNTNRGVFYLEKRRDCFAEATLPRPLGWLWGRLKNSEVAK